MTPLNFEFSDTAGLCETCFSLMRQNVVATVKVSYNSTLIPGQRIEKILCAEHALHYWQLAQGKEPK